VLIAPHAKCSMPGRGPALGGQKSPVWHLWEQQPGACPLPAALSHSEARSDPGPRPFRGVASSQCTPRLIAPAASPRAALERARACGERRASLFLGRLQREERCAPLLEAWSPSWPERAGKDGGPAVVGPPKVPLLAISRYGSRRISTAAYLRGPFAARSRVVCGSSASSAAMSLGARDCS